MPENQSPKRDWIDISLKAATPLLVGLVVAWVGLFGDETLTKISNKQQSARLLTQLQIEREQAETELRKDIFAQALEAFLLKESPANGAGQSPSLLEISKQLLRLELLALNFGDSLSVSPLFVEMRKDLESSSPADDKERPDYAAKKARLITRLDSLAQRVAGRQLSSLEKHGISRSFSVPLVEYKGHQKKGMGCLQELLVKRSFSWPSDDLLWQYDLLDDHYQPTVAQAEIDRIMETDDFRSDYLKRAQISFENIERTLDVNVTQVNHCKKSARVQVFVRRIGWTEPEADPEFKLDYYNFPMVDNTRLKGNHRFAIVAENFRLDADEPRIDVTAVIFPSEYASLRDRPGMEEVRTMLESALEAE